LFYLDPPYWGPKLYRFNFTNEDFSALAERLRQIQGKFILSLNDTSDARTLFTQFQILSIETTYTSRVHATKRYPELLITNFKPSSNKRQPSRNSRRRRYAAQDEYQIKQMMQSKK
jgi:DNA adenine methylase